MHTFAGLGEAPQTPPAAQQYYEETHALTIDISLAANQELLGQGVFIDSDGDFVLKAIVGTQTGNYQIRFRLPSGRYWPSAYTRNANLVGTAQFPVPVEPNAVFPAGSQVQFDIRDISGASNTIQLVLIGAKLLRTR
jgi:hypothetical protein